MVNWLDQINGILSGRGPDQNRHADGGSHVEQETHPPVEDFNASDIRKVVDKADFLLHTSYEMHGSRACPQTGLECMNEMDVSESGWHRLNKEQRTEVLNRSIDWTSFAPIQADKIIDNIASGKERQQWFDGVPAGWRGVGERNVQEWVAFERLPETEQIRAAARMIKESRTLGGDGVMVHAKWEEMSDSQRSDVIFHQLRTSEGSNLPYHQWKTIIKEELGYWPGEQAPQPIRREGAATPQTPGPLEHARQRAREAARPPGRGKDGPDIG